MGGSLVPMPLFGLLGKYVYRREIVSSTCLVICIPEHEISFQATGWKTVGYLGRRGNGWNVDGTCI